MSSTANFIVSGVLTDGTPIIFGAIPSDGTSHPEIHHVNSASQFQAESWDGEHAEHEHHDHEDRRVSIYLEEAGGVEVKNPLDDEEEEPIASSAQFERTRSASLAAALLELDPRGVPLVQFFKLATSEPLLEVDEGDDEVEPSGAELVLSQLLFTLRSLKMSGGEAKHSEAVQRLRELEEELRVAGAVTPADPAVSEAVARALAVAGAGRDVQIRVNQSKHTTTTKTVYETETPAMAHMDSDAIRNLQQQILADISSGAEHHAGPESGTTQKKETAEEGFTNEDGSVVVSKKMTRVVTTTRTTLPGEGEEPSAPESPVESLGSVKDRIAKFEQLKDFPPEPTSSGTQEETSEVPRPAERSSRASGAQEELEQVSGSSGAPQPAERSSVQSGVSGAQEEEASVAQESSEAPAIQVSEPERRDSEDEDYLQPSPVGIVITPHTPVPPEYLEEQHQEAPEDDEPREPLELSEPEPISRAELKDTREYSDEELAHELQPSEEHVSTAEVKDTKSYTPTSSDDERSQKGVSPPVPQVRHAISPSVASEVLSSHDDELAAHFVAESFEKHDEGSVEQIEQMPVYRGHHSPGQTSPIISEHPIAQEYAESVTSHDEGDNLSLKSGHEPEIARHSVESVLEEEESQGLGDFAKKAGMIVGGVIAAPVALAAVGAKAAYDALKKDDEEESEEPEEKMITTTTIMESPIEHEDIPAPHAEEVSTRAPHEHEHHEEPHLVTETVTTTTITQESHESPVPSEKEAEHLEASVASSPAPSSHVESERPVAESPAASEKEHVVETTTTTTVTREYEEEPEQAGFMSPAESQEHLVKETTTTTTVTREFYDDEPEAADSPAPSSHVDSEHPIAGSPVESEKEHIVETTTTTTVTREFYEDEPEHQEAQAPVSESHKELETPEKVDRAVESPIQEPEAHLVTETTTTTTVTREYYDEPQLTHHEDPEQESYSPAPSSQVESERPIAESPVESEKEHVVETTTTTTITREYEEEPEPTGSLSSAQSQEHLVKETTTTTTVTRELYDEEPKEQHHEASVSSSPAPSSHVESERPAVTETTTTTVTREHYDEPEFTHHEDPEQESPTPSSHVESERPIAESPVESEKESAFSEPHVVETTTTTIVTREYEDEPEQPGSLSPSESHEHLVKETITTTTVTREFQQDSDEKESQEPQTFEHSPNYIVSGIQADGTPIVSGAISDLEATSEEPVAEKVNAPHHQFYEEPAHKADSGDDDDDSDDEGFGKKALGFAKKAGMVAGAVVAAPVALAAVGAKAAYDALKKDDEEDQEEQETLMQDNRERRALDSPASEPKFEQEHSQSHHYEPEEPYIPEATTTSAWTTEYLDSDEDKDHKDRGDALTSVSAAESPVPSEKDSVREIHGSGSPVVETTTTTTVTRELQETESPVPSEEAHHVAESPVHSEQEPEAHLVTETTTTTTVTREYYDEPELIHHEAPEQESYSPAPSSHLESERPAAESPVESEKEHVVETTTTTTVTREYEVEEPEQTGSVSPAHSQEHLVKETTTTTTVTREFYEDEPEHQELQESYSPAPSSHVESERPMAESPVESEKDHAVETTTTTTVTQEFHEDHEPVAESGETAESPAVPERPIDGERSPITETTITVTTDFDHEDHEDDRHDVEPVATITLTQDYDHLDEESRAESPEPRDSGTPAESEKSLPHVTETTTTTTVTREYYEDEPEVSPTSSPAPSSHVESERPVSDSPAFSEPHVVETTTTTTVTREYEEEPKPTESLSPSESHEHLVKETITTTTTVTRELHQEEPEHHEFSESPAAQYFHEEPHHEADSPVRTEQAPLLSEPAQPEEEESDGEGFGSKMLGFAKKAGMVAGAVVAAPVALAAVGAKSAYDALKKDDDHEDEEEQEALMGDVRERRALDSPVSEPKFEQEHPITHDSPVPSEQEHHHVTETTTTTTVTREFYDEPESPVGSEKEFEESAPHAAESPVDSERSIPHVVETTTTTTVTRDFDEESTPESPEEKEETTTVTREVYQPEHGNEPKHHFTETTTTTVSRHVYDEPEEVEGVQESREEESDEPHVVETTTTTTVTREFQDDEEDQPSEHGAFPLVQETTTTTTVTREFYGEEPEDVEAPESEKEDIPSPTSGSVTSISRETHSEEPRVVETTTTTTVTREYHDEPVTMEDTTVTREFHDEPVVELPVPSEKDQELGSPVESERSVPHAVETTTTTTVTREFDDETPFHQDSHRSESPFGSEADSQKDAPHVAETTTTTTVTREIYEDEPEHQPYEEPNVIETTTTTTVTREYELPEEESERLSETAQSLMTAGTPAESEKSIPHVMETTTTATRELYEDEPEHHEASVSSSPAPSSHVESERPVAESPALSEPHVVETTTTTTVTRKYEEEPKPTESLSPTESHEHLVKETITTTTVTRELHQEEPEHQEFSESPAAQYFHEEPHHEADSPVHTEQAPLLSEPAQPEDEESDGEGFGSKMLGFAKKAGMVAGAVVAAPVALAAVGAKSAYDALKKDDNHGDEEEEEALMGDVRESQALNSPVSEPKFEQEHPISHEPPVPSEQEHHHVTETTTTTTVTREFYDEPESPFPQEAVGSPVESEKSIPHVVETTTTTTVTREFKPESSLVSEHEFGQHEPSRFAESPVGSEGSISNVVETETTSTAARDFYGNEPEQESDSQKDKDLSQFQGEESPSSSDKDQDAEQKPEVVERQGSYSSGYSPKSPSPVGSVDENQSVTEAAESTTVTQEPQDLEEEVTTEKHLEEFGEAATSPTPSEEAASRIVETAITTVTREHFEPESPRKSPYEQPTEYGRVDSHDAPASPTPSEESVERSEDPERHVIETTTTTVTQEYEQLEESAGTPADSEKSLPHHVETTTTTTVTREFYEDEPENPESAIESEKQSYSPAPVAEEQHDAEAHLVTETTTTTTVTREYYDEPELTHHEDPERESLTPSSHVESERPIAESPVESEKEPAFSEPHVVETTTTTTVTREYEEEPKPTGSLSPAQSQEHLVKETTTTTTVIRELHQEDPEHHQEISESPAAQYFHEEPHHEAESPVHTEQAPLLSEQAQPEDEESDGEGFGSKMLGFAKKAGMVAGAVVAAPVALAAVGAKSAYDALKKDDDHEDEEEQEALMGDVRERRALDSPVSETKLDHEHPISHESPVPSEQEHHHVTETTTTTTVTREFYDDEPEAAHSPAPSSHAESKRPIAESPVESEKEHVVHQGALAEKESPVTETSITVHREEFDGDSEKSPHIVETTTTTVTRELYQEPEEEGVRPPSGSEADDESHAPRYLETTTTTTVTREYEVSEDEEDVPRGSPVPSEESVTHVVETTTTTTVTQEHFEPEDQEEEAISEDERLHRLLGTTRGTAWPDELCAEDPPPVTPTPSEQAESKIMDIQELDEEEAKGAPAPSEEDESQREAPASPTPSEESVSRVVETTTTTTTVTREYHPEDQEALGPPAPSEEGSTRFIETTTTTVTREHFEPEEEHVVESREYESPVPSDRSAAPASPVPSEESVSRVVETTTTTTVTREHFEPEDQEHIVESEEYPTGAEEESHGFIQTTTTTTTTTVRHEPAPSPTPSEEAVSKTIETTTTTTTQEHFEPEHVVESQEYDRPSSGSPVPSEKVLSRDFHEPVEEEEDDSEGFGSKMLGFAKKAGMVAGAVVAAPVALAAVGAKSAYDALKKDDDQEEESTQEHGARFYEPEEEDRVVESTEYSSPVKEEPKIISPAHSSDKQEFEKAVEEEPFIIESEDYSPVREDQRISSPVHSDAGDVQDSTGQEEYLEETPRAPESADDAPYVIESESYEPPVDRDEQRISSPVGSDVEESEDVREDVIESEAYERHQEREDPFIVESEEYVRSPSGSPRPFEDSTITTVLSVHHEPPAIPEPEVDEEEMEDRSVIEFQEYGSEPTTVTTVEHVEPPSEEYPATSPTTVTTVESEHLEHEAQEPYVVESEEYRGSPLDSKKGYSPAGSPIPSERSEDNVIETTTTTTTFQEHYEPEEHIIESQEYTGSPVPSEKAHHEVPTSPTPSEESVSRVVETTTTTTVTREYHPEDQEAPGSPAPSEEGSTRFIETTTTTVTREHFEPEEEHVVESREYESPVPSDRSAAPASPVPSEESVSRVVETTTTTTVTREHFEPEDQEHIVESEGYPTGVEEESHGFIQTTTTTTTTTVRHEPEDAPSPTPSEEAVSKTIETTTTTTTQKHFEPEPIEQSSQSPAAQYFHEEPHHETAFPVHTEQAPLLSEPAQPEDEESDEEGFGSKMLGFAKKAGMVAGAVVAAPVALAAVGAKSAYDALKKDDDNEDEEEQEALMGDVRERRALDSQAHESQSPVPSDQEHHHVTETTTTKTVTRELYDEEQEAAHSPAPSSHLESERPLAESPVQSEKEVPHVIETTTTTTVTREYFDDEQEVARSPSSHVDSEKPVAESPVESEKEHVIETTTTTTVTREYFDEPETAQQDSESEGSFVDHGEEVTHQTLPLQSTEAAFKLSTEDVAEQTAEKLVSEVFSPLDRTLIESEQYRASIESLDRRSPVEQKKSLEDVATEALQNVTKIKYGDPEEAEEPQKEEDEEWKVYDRHGEVLEEFSTQLTDDVIQEAEGDATTQILMSQADYSPRRSKFLKQESCQEISNEPEVDYYSDLQEKLNILAGEKNNLSALPEEEPSSASDQLDVIHESDQEEVHRELEEQKEREEAEELTALHLVDQVLEQVVQELSEEEEDDQKTISDAYMTADSASKDNEYDTCVTSQDDTYESAQGWTSQDSEYTTATSQAPSRLSDEDGDHTAREERQETSTPQAMLSPVDSDRHFTVSQDFDMPVIRAFDPDDFLQSTARSTPDVALQVTIEEEDESDDKLPISPSGVLLPPQSDPGRPVSPVPPRRDAQEQEGVFVFVREDTIVEPTPPPLIAEDVSNQEDPESDRQEPERIHGVAMEASSDPANSESSRYSRQLSDLSSSAGSHADTVIRVEGERSGSSDSLEVVSVISAGKSLTPEDPDEKPVVQQQEQEPQVQEQEVDAEQLGFEVYDADTEETEHPQPLEELETVEEEPEDSDSLNEGGGSGHSSVGVPADTLALLGKYKHQSSDNLSLTSLQEFERLEKEVGARGDGSLTRSEIELLVAGRLNKSGEGSVSSLAEFERLEKELVENQSPPEDVMMLSDIREESEAEDMSIRDDDEDVEGVGSDTELKSRPVQEEDLRGITPIAPSPTDSLEHAVDPIQLQYLETSTDSLEPTFQEIEVEQRADSAEDTSLTEYEMVPRVMEASTTDSLDGTATLEKDSLLEGASQGIESTQSTHGLLSGDTMGTLVTDDDKDSLDGEVSSMLQSYPTTLTTFQTTVVGPDGTVQTISRRVETRVTDPLMSHVQFTGTESQERLDQLPDEEQFETVDTEGNVTRTTFRRDHDEPPRF